MKFEYFIFVLNILEVYLFQQNDYTIVHERISLDYYNTSYVKDLNFELFHYTRYEKRLNASGHLLEDLGTEVTNTVQAYKFQSNEYRQFPMFYSANVCVMWNADIFGMGPSHYNTNFKKCPIKKGYYYVVNVQIDESKYPPYAPRGRYMLELCVLYKDTILIGRGKWYITIKPTNPLERVI